MPKVSKKTGSKKLNKSFWIRSQPASMTANEVVEKAAKEKIQLSAAQVYVARSTAKKAGGSKGKPGPKPKKQSLLFSQDVEGQITRLILNHGLIAIESAVRAFKLKVGA